MPSSDVRSSEASGQNARGKNFQKFTCFVFRGSYFRVLVTVRENRENLDLAKIFRYTRVTSVSGIIASGIQIRCPTLPLTCVLFIYIILRGFFNKPQQTTSALLIFTNLPISCIIVNANGRSKRGGLSTAFCSKVQSSSNNPTRKRVRLGEHGNEAKTHMQLSACVRSQCKLTFEPLT